MAAITKMVTVNSSPTLTSLMLQAVDAEGVARDGNAPGRRDVRSIGVLFEDAVEDGIRHRNSLIAVYVGSAVLRHPLADHAHFFTIDGIQQHVDTQHEAMRGQGRQVE